VTSSPTTSERPPILHYWAPRRVVRGLKRLRDPRFRAHQWQVRVVKTRLGTETIRDYLIDRSYGGRCGGTYPGRWGQLGYRGTSSAHYYVLQKIFQSRYVPIAPSDVLVDVGCGKGRVLNFWLKMGVRNRLIGIEIDERFAKTTRLRLAGFDNVEVLCGDAFELLPDDGTIFYIFNPFTRETTIRFKDALIDKYGRGSNITLVYYMCNYSEDFEADPAWTVTHLTEKTFHPAAIMRPARLQPVAEDSPMAAG
jgi:hypothetical protein